MSASIHFNSKEFNQAIGQYLRETSKDSATALNGKTADLLYKTAKHTPKANRQEIQAAIMNPKLITWYMNRWFGRGQWTSDDWAEGVKKLRRRLSSVGYARHGLIVAAKKFRGESSRPGKQPTARSRQRHQAIKVRSTRPATLKSPRTAFHIDYGASSGSDAMAKSNLFTRPASLARRAIMADLEKYLARKMQKRAKDHAYRG